MQKPLWGVDLCGAFGIVMSFAVLHSLSYYMTESVSFIVLPLIYAGSLVIVSINLMRLREWARVLYLFLMVIWAGIGLSVYLFFLTQYTNAGLQAGFVFFFIGPAVFSLTYLSTQTIKARFQEAVHWLGKKILVVDDDHGFTTMIRTNLILRGFEVITAFSGERGLVLAQSRKPDLILLDVILPGIKGREVCLRLKSNQRTSDIPVIFLTAKNSPDDIRAEMEAGGLTHITKPVDFSKLLNEINKALGIE